MGKIKDIFEKAADFENKNRAAILTGIGAVGIWVTAYKAYRAGLKAASIIEAKKKDLEDVAPDDKEAKRTVIWEGVKEIFPSMIPVIIFGGVSTASILGSHSVLNKKVLTLSTAYTLTDTAYREYRDKVKDILGEKRANRVREVISRDHVQNNPPPSDDGQVIITGDGDVLCFDEYSGRYFYSNADKIGAAILKLSYDIMDEMWISLNDFYLEIGLPEIKMGDEFGWRVDRLDHGVLPIKYTATMTEDKRPCIAVQFDVHVRDHY